jgi:hypothetical protein
MNWVITVGIITIVAMFIFLSSSFPLNSNLVLHLTDIHNVLTTNILVFCVLSISRLCIANSVGKKILVGAVWIIFTT